MLVNGRWSKSWDPFQSSNKKGEFIRQTSSFRHWIEADGSGPGNFKAEPNRYHLYVALICPWASRTLMARQLLGLNEVISLSVVEPFLTDQGWRFGDFPGSTSDHVNGYEFIHQLYTHADKTVSGRATVPVLWDKKTNTIVNNESADIIKMLNDSFRPWAKTTVNLRPDALLEQIEDLNLFLYEKINNGVYRAGFAQSQEAYELAVNDVFNGLEVMEKRLANSKYLFGEKLTESDIRLFVTLVRFDAAYYGLFKCNIKRIIDFPNLYRYMSEIYSIPNIDQTVNLQHIKSGYYSVKDLNPLGIVPMGPEAIFESRESNSKGEIAA